MKKFCTDWDEFKDNQLCNAWVAAAVIGSSAIGAGAQIFGASKAADAQKEAAQAGLDFQRKVYGDTRQDLAPYRNIGKTATTELTKQLPELIAPIELTQEWLESTPGYQFTKEQGLKAVQNSAAARGLGVSGAALKGAANFATGLADNTYKTQFDVANINKTNAYNRLKSLVDTGQSAATQTGSFGQSAATNIGNLSVGQGNAEAAMWNTIGSGIKNFASDVGGYAAYKGLYGGTSSTPNPNNRIYTGDPTIPGFA